FAGAGVSEGSRLFLTLTITPSSSVDNVSLVILPNSNPAYQDCGGIEGRSCVELCPLFWASNGIASHCVCTESRTTTITAPPCVVGIQSSTWGRVKKTFK